MRIRERAPLTTCEIKMSDEMNGNTTGKLPSCQKPDSKLQNDTCSNEENASKNLKTTINKGLKSRLKKAFESEETKSPGSPNSSQDDFGASGGGRLKFFKDGKFILELSHRKEGEKTCWIPVTKTTYWPAVGTPRTEGSTTLSVSDDSSSVQSSPWQRDHCWKQPHPKPNLGRELEFYYHCRKRCIPSIVSRIRGRKPFASECQLSFNCKRRMQMGKRSLAIVLKFLWEKAINSCKLEQGIVSPRKRILRELEKVTLEEASKRQRAKATVRTVSSHSISSILAKDDDSVLRNLLRSPSPENLRPCIPSTPFPSHHIPVVYPPAAATAFFPQVSQAFRSQIHPANFVWPYPPSSPAQLPLYPLHSYSPNWPHIRASVQDSSADVPLNLSKNAS